MSEIREYYNLLSYLKEIEKVTDLNGCYFINIKDNYVIESTVPFKVPDEILWEISVLRDTFTQFSEGIGQGALNELMIRGDNGNILLYDFEPHILLLAMGSDEINLSYIKLAMIDIVERIKKKLSEIGEDILNIPRKELGALGRVEEEKEKITPGAEQEVIASQTEAVTAKETKKTEPPETEPIPTQDHEKPTIEPASIETEVTKPQELETPPSKLNKARTEPIKPEKQEIQEEIPVRKGAKGNLEELINSIEHKELNEKYKTLDSIFKKLKNQLKFLTGKELYDLLELLKDVILMNIGTSVTLYDISKASNELNKIRTKLSTAQVKSFEKRIDNWATRIIK